MLENIAAMQASLDTLDQREWLADWQDCLRRLAYDESLAASIRGYSLRLLFDRQQVDEHELARLAGWHCRRRWRR